MITSTLKTLFYILFFILLFLVVLLVLREYPYQDFYLNNKDIQRFNVLAGVEKNTKVIKKEESGTITEINLIQGEESKSILFSYSLKIENQGHIVKNFIVYRELIDDVVVINDLGESIKLDDLTVGDHIGVKYEFDTEKKKYTYYTITKFSK